MPSIRPIALGVLLSTATLAACQRSSVETAPAASAAMPGGVTPIMLALGDSLFAAGSCQRCHGVAGVGGQNGPPLTTGPWLQADGTFEGIVRVITEGVPQEKLKNSARRPMRGRGGPMELDDARVRAVAGYVYSISRDKH